MLNAYKIIKKKKQTKDEWFVFYWTLENYALPTNKTNVQLLELSEGGSSLVRKIWLIM